MMTPKEFGDMAYLFMTGVPSSMTRGFCLMDPESLKKQRLTYARYWAKLILKDIERVRQQ
jgi:hypothetical protein